MPPLSAWTSRAALPLLIHCAFLGCRWTALLSPAPLGSPLSPHIHRQAMQQTRAPMRACAARPSAAPGRRSYLCYGGIPPSSQQLHRRAAQHTQAPTLANTVSSSAATGRHCGLHHVLDLLRSHQIHRQALQQMGTPMPRPAWMRRPSLDWPRTALLTWLWRASPQFPANPSPSKTYHTLLET